MKLRIDDYCIRCGICEDLYPDLFKRNYEEHCMDVLYDEIPEELKDRAIQAVKDCAVTAIKLRGEVGAAEAGAAKTTKLVIDEELCEGCAVCAVSCPKGCIHVQEDDSIFFGDEGCVSCGICAKACPAHAISVAGKE